MTAAAKDAIERVFTNLGGVDALTRWAEAHPDTFYTVLFPKLLPIQLKHGGDSDGEPMRIGSIVRVIVGPVEKAVRN